MFDQVRNNISIRLTVQKEQGRSPLHFVLRARHTSQASTVRRRCWLIWPLSTCSLALLHRLVFVSLVLLAVDAVVSANVVIFMMTPECRDERPMIYGCFVRKKLTRSAKVLAAS